MKHDASADIPPEARLKPGETRALIDVSGESVIFLARHPMSVKPEPDVTLQMPIDQLLLVVAQAVIQRAQAKQAGMLTPNVLPGTGGMPQKM